MNLEPDTKRLLAGTRESFRWLEPLRITELDLIVARWDFVVYYGGAQAQVTVSVIGRHGHIEVFVAPRAGAPRAELPDLLKLHGLPEPPSNYDAQDVTAGIAVVRAQAEALKQLRSLELRGDWTAFDHARESP